MLQERKGKGMCAVLLVLAMCFGPVPAEAQAEGAPLDSARRYTVEYTVNGTPLAGLGLYYTGRKRRTGPGGRTGLSG